MNGEKLSEPGQKEGKPDESNLNNLINTNFTSPNRWFSRYVIAAMLVDGKQKIAH